MKPIPVNLPQVDANGSCQFAFTVQHLCFGYPGSDFVLSLDSLHLAPSETLLVCGPSGAGKTTLLRLLCGLLTPQSGTICHHVNGSRHELTPSHAAEWRLRYAGLIFQDFALVDYLTVRDNALLPLRFQNPSEEEWHAALTRLPEVAERLDLRLHLGRPAAHLSQGERQRVAVLRALLTQPSILFADEPTASLDRSRRDQTMALLEEHCERAGAPLVLVSHDPELIERVSRQLNVETLHQSSS